MGQNNSTTHSDPETCREQQLGWALAGEWPLRSVEQSVLQEPPAGLYF